MYYNKQLEIKELMLINDIFFGNCILLLERDLPDIYYTEFTPAYTRTCDLQFFFKEKNLFQVSSTTRIKEASIFIFRMYIIARLSFCSISANVPHIDKLLAGKTMD